MTKLLLVLILFLPLEIHGLDLGSSGKPKRPAINQMPDLALQPPDPPAGVAYPQRIAPQNSGYSSLPDKAYLSVDVLLVIYTHYVFDTVSQGQIDTLLAEVDQARQFFARNSRSRFNVNIAGVEVIDREQTLDQHWHVAPPGGYWLPFWEEDGVHSVRNDLYDLGYVDNQFSAVFVYYAWENVDTAFAAYGGGAYGGNSSDRGGSVDH